MTGQQDSSTYVRIFGSSLHGEMKLPPSKSHTMRALYFAAMATGVSSLTNLLASPDTEAMIQALSLLGAKIEKKNSSNHSPFSFDAEVHGVGGVIRNLPSSDQSHILDVGNSGQVLRFIAPLLCFQKTPAVVTGDNSVQTLRPMKPLVDALKSLGATITYQKKDGYAPLILSGPLTDPKEVHVVGIDSQPVSALLMSLGFHPRRGESVIHVQDMGEKPWVEFTLWWLMKVGITYLRPDETTFIIPAGQKISSFSYTIPSDASSLAFPLALALMTPSSITFHGIDLHDPQGDRKIVPLLQSLGAEISYNEESLQLKVIGPQNIRGAEIDIDAMIDALPILAVIAAGSMKEGSFRLFNAQSARKKESDRIDAISGALRGCGFQVSTGDDEIIVYATKEKGNPAALILQSYNDHRIAMASSVLAAAILSQNKDSQGIVVGPIECIQKSFPHFFETMGAQGLRWEKVSV